MSRVHSNHGGGKRTIRENPGWHVDYEFQDVSNPAPDLINRGIKLDETHHLNHAFLNHASIDHLYVKSVQDNRGEVKLDDFNLGDLTVVEGPTMKESNLDIPRNFYYNQHSFSIFAKYKKSNLFGSGNDLLIEQEFLFTEYGKSIRHEPLGVLSAARFYPMLRFNYANRTESPIDEIRVDYKFRFRLFQPLSPMRIYRLGSNQSGVWRDKDFVDPLDMGDAKGLFDKAEKPLVFEIITTGFEGDRVSWDNIHQWTTRRSTRKAGLAFPPTPGTSYAVHIHWRWGKVYTTLGGRPFAGYTNQAGDLMIDPKIPFQELYFAILYDDVNYAISRQSKGLFYEDFITTMKSQYKSLPRSMNPDSPQGYNTWFSITAHNTAAYESDFFKGTLFAHGIFFAHNEDEDPEKSGMAAVFQKRPLPPWAYKRQYVPRLPPYYFIR